MRRGHPFLALFAAIAVLACAVAAGGVRRRQQRQLERQHGCVERRRLIKSNADNAGTTHHGRLEELHRGVHPRRDLRPGAPGRRLHGEEGPQPRLRADRAEGAEERRHRRLPRVHEHRAHLVLRRAAAGHPEGSRSRRSATRRTTSRRRAWSRSPPTPFTSANAVGMLKKKADELGVTKVSDLKGKSQDLTLYGSPECRQRPDCLVGLAEGLRPEVQEVHAGRHRPALRRARQGTGGPVDHLHDRRAAVDARRHGHARGRQDRCSRPAT